MSQAIIPALLAAWAAGFAPPPAAPPGPPAAGEEYVFAPDTSRYVGILRNGYWHIGQIDAEGNFEWGRRIRENGPYSGPQYEEIDLIPKDGKPRPCYELRSSRLIKGGIDTKGNFVPEIGSKVILFKDYRYSPTATPIWNLPGMFIKKSDLKAWACAAAWVTGAGP
jgi:hypothetical protein